MLKQGPLHVPARQMLEHMRGHMLWHVPDMHMLAWYVPNHVLARHVPQHVLARHVLGHLLRLLKILISNNNNILPKNHA